MKPFILFALLMIIGFSIKTHATIRYVKADATGANNGTSWADAYTDLQAASLSNADTLWVANGLYKPTSTTDRSISFDFGTKKVFGGFTGTETLLGQRNYTTYQTVLSGDIGVAGDSTDNSRCIVKNLSGFVWIDGFKITGGNASPSGPGSGTMGAGVYLNNYNNPSSSDAYISNCFFTSNTAHGGGAISCLFGTKVNITGCTFQNNIADAGGAVYVITSSYAIITDCIFYSNSAEAYGGAIANYAMITVDRCIFSGNNANSIGGAIASSATSLSAVANISNSLFAGNIANRHGAISISGQVGTGFGINVAYVFNSTIAHNKSLSQGGACVDVTVLKNSIVWGNVDSNNQVAVNQIDGYTATGVTGNTIQNSALVNNYAFDPQFINQGNGANAPFNAANYDYHLNASSLAIDTGDNTGIQATAMDLDRMGRMYNAIVDLGCYEWNDCPSKDGTITAYGDTVFCYGDSVLLSAPSGTNYLWSNGDTTQPITVTTSGTYIVSVVNAAGCLYQYSKQVIVHDLPSPVITQNGNTLQTGTFSSYQWIEGNTDIPGAIGQIYVPTADGVYKVRVTNAEGCEGVSEPFNFTLTGIHETYDQSGLQVYPNPAKDHLTIDVTALDDKVESYTIYNIVGKAIVQQEKVSAGKTFEINLPASLANGNYILQLNTNKETYRAKFLIRR